jgi:hypothetical protein
MIFPVIAMTAEAGVSAIIAIPNDRQPFSLVAKGWRQAKARGVVTDSDSAYLDTVKSGLTQPDKAALSNLTSRAEGVAALVSEYGIALARPFTLGGVPVSVGITPKFQRVNRTVGLAAQNLVPRSHHFTMLTA